MKKLLYILAIAGGLGLSSCDKGSDNNGDEPVDVSKLSPKQIVMLHPWIMTTWRDSNTTDYKGYEQLEDCSKDDYWTFRENDILIDEKSNVCSGNTQTRTTIWSMADPNDKKLTLYTNFNFSILTLNDKEMVLLRVHRQTTDTLFSTVKFRKP